MSKFIKVAVSQGLLRGRVVVSKLGYEYFSFQGIPYAKPPVGNLRFKPPHPVQKWTGTKDVFKEGNCAPQFDIVKKAFRGDEDCLFLNVYTPKNINKTSLKAVMIWIHGGGFTFGHGETAIYGPDFLVQHDIILVTMNYRLGVLGFLNLEIPEAPGNVGLQDQVEAMKWVKNEIGNFGGDPDNITLFGVSAGASCVHFHMLSDVSRGLFTKAIAQSGTALNNWAFTDLHLKRAFRLGQALGYYTDDKRKLFKFLHDAPPSVFVQKQNSVVTLEENVQGIIHAFIPSVENKQLGNMFLSDTPRNLIKSDKLLDIPFITGITSHEGIIIIGGITSHEGIIIIGAILKNRQFLKHLNERFEHLVPHKDTLPGINISRIESKMKDFYFENKKISLKHSLTGITNLYTDIAFMLPMVETISLLKTHVPSSPLYCYRFCYDGQFGWFKRFLIKEWQLDWTLAGVGHCDDIGYIFTNEMLGPQTLVPRSDEMKIVNNITSLWTNFVKTGNPSSNWLPVTSDSIQTLDIGLTLKMNNSLEKPRTDFWKQIYSSVTF